MSTANLIYVEFGIWAVLSWVNKEYNSGDRTQTCGVHLSKILLLDVKLSTLTVCLQHKRKSKSQSQMLTGNLRSISQCSQ